MTAFLVARLFRTTLLVGVAVGLGQPAAWAQEDDGELEAVSQPVVQAIPGAPGMRLNAALTELARNPRDLGALVEAGQASTAIGDADAAIGFFRRADQLKPGDANVKAGLAGAYVLAEDPYSAIPLFDEAERAGPIDPKLLSARGLAYDLVGDNERAQRFYRQSLTVGPDDETLRRLALSQAISGDRRGMEITLSPLLQRQDKAAWRTRAFAFAILGQQAEAEAVARSNLPESQALGMVAYLRYMPRLTAAQQASAANLGHFPRAAEIGRDDPRVAAFVRPRAVLAVAEKPAVAAPASRDERKRRSSRTRSSDVEAKPVLAPAPPPQLPPQSQPARIAVASPVAVTPVQALPPAPKPTPPPAPKPAPVSSAAAPGPGFGSLETSAPAGGASDLKQVTPAQASLPRPLPTAPPPTAPPPTAPPVLAEKPATPRAPAKPRNLADVFADLTPPSREIEPAAGAVDLRRLAGAGGKGLVQDPRTVTVSRGKDTKSPAATQPSRIWVQLATSRDKAGLSADFRRFARADADLFKARKGFTSAWGLATRLLIGPFESEKAANSFVTQLKKAGISDAFMWTSPAGQVVDPLSGQR